MQSVAEEDRDEGIKDLVDLVLKKMVRLDAICHSRPLCCAQDHDHDGRISLSDFETSVKADPLLLEAFGPCLPQTKHIEKFLKSAAQEF